MKRTHPLFNFRKEGSSAPSVPKASSGGKKLGLGGKGGGFSGSPKRTAPEEEPSLHLGATRPKERKDDVAAVASQTASIMKQVKRKMSPIPPEEGRGGVREGWNSNWKWKYASTYETVRETKGRSFPSRPSRVQPSDNSDVARRPEFVRIEMPPEVNTPEKEREGCWKRLVGSCGAARRKCRRMWKAAMKTKREWDRWNPDKSNPIIACINESKLAGLKESIKPNRGILYRILWVTLFFVALGCGTLMSVNTYRFHNATPVLFAFESRQVKTSDLPYPTVTASHYSSFKHDSVAEYLLMYNNYEDSHENWTKSTIGRLLYFMKHTCQSNVGFSSLHKLPHPSVLDSSLFERGLKGNDLTDTADENLVNRIIPAMKEASQNCTEMLSYCSWNMNATESCSSFAPSFKSTGGSCAFNKMPDVNLYKSQQSFKSLWSQVEEQNEDWGNWSLESHLRNVHQTPQGDQKGPKRQAAGGSPWGLSFLLTMDESINTECPQFDSSGTRISISVPGVDVDVERDNIAVPPHHEATFKLYPDLTIADENLRTILPPSRRGCLFEDEGNLTYYKSYNQENCRRECIAEHILSKCKCTLLSHPNSAGRVLCQAMRFECIKDAERELVDPKKSGVAARHCSHCLPSCTSMSLRMETVMTPYSKEHPPPMTEGINKTTSLAHAYYAQDSVVAKVRQRRHSEFETISEVGATYESTNDVSWLGVARIIVSLTVFIPTAYATYKLLQISCLSSLILCRKFNIRIFRLRNRLVVHPPKPAKKRVRFADEEANVPRDDNPQNQFKPRSTNFDIFLLDSSHIVLPMPPPASLQDPQPSTSSQANQKV